MTSLASPSYSIFTHDEMQRNGQKGSGRSRQHSYIKDTLSPALRANLWYPIKRIYCSGIQIENETESSSVKSVIALDISNLSAD